MKRGLEETGKALLPTQLGGSSRAPYRLANKARLLLREAKAMVSSDFEAALLKATRPDDEVAKAKHVEAIVDSVEDFRQYQGPECDPWALLLHKVWSRIAEKDARTVAKATYVLHRLVCSVEQPALDALVEAYAQLATTNSARSGTRYHDHAAVVDLDAVHAVVAYDVLHWRRFVSRYWTYVDALWRACAAAPANAEDDRHAALRSSARTLRLLKLGRRAADAATLCGGDDHPMPRECATHITTVDAPLLTHLFLTFALYSRKPSHTPTAPTGGPPPPAVGRPDDRS